MSFDSETWSCRDSWPPTQMRLKPTVPSKDNTLPSLDNIDENPLTYFLTPAPDLYDDDMDAQMMMFDAGIEDASNPTEVIRSVSPSTLDGLRKQQRSSSRSVSPDTESDVMTPDDNNYDDDDNEDYIRFSSMVSSHGLVSLEDALRRRPKSPIFGSSSSGSRGTMSPQFRGRPRGRVSGGRSPRSQLAAAAAASSRTSHTWREPSPDVWSIEEETEEEMMSEDSDMHKTTATMINKGLTKSGKPKKTVRFVLPVEEI